MITKTPSFLTAAPKALLTVTVTSLMSLMLALPSDAQQEQPEGNNKGVFQCHRTESVWWAATGYVPVKCTITNRLTKPFRFLRLNNSDYAAWDLTVVLKDENGNVVRPTGLSGTPQVFKPTEKDFVQLAPGKSYDLDLDNLEVGRRYKQIKSGRYTFELQLQVSDTETRKRLIVGGTCEVEVRDPRDHLTVTPVELSQTTQFPDGNKMARVGRVSIIERSANAYWLVYLFDLKTGDNAEPKLFIMHWLGQLSHNGASYQVRLKEDGDIHVEFQDVHKKDRHVVIERFVGAPKVIK